MIIEEARAKINLTLPVLRKRSDEYHELDSVMHSITLADTITLEKADRLSLSVTGDAPEGGENLMWQAAEMFFKETGVASAVSMTLEKRIPSEAGLGGGSADAAAVLRGLARLYTPSMDRDCLLSMAETLGSDVPFQMEGGCARCRGRGTELTALSPWEGLPLIVVKPDFSVSTKKAYTLLDAREAPPSSDMTELCAKAIADRDRSLLTRSLSNDFEAVLFHEEPRLREAFTFLSSFSVPARMTGSGSAFFLLPKEKDRLSLMEAIKKARPTWQIFSAETDSWHSCI
ncbi:MAG: 4-(cytidine 5'-diphospho)-2-C-methyl-D-erythritol kinase [Dialister sp.]|nr:4-(cytidine 5'-diphospho)-2-C-methyl-D-erythritol kinase [Dialister sp.]